MLFSGLDFDFDKRQCDPAETLFADLSHALWQACFRTVDEPSAALDVSSLRDLVRRRTQGQELLVSRAVSLPGLRATHLPREPSGHRGVPEGAEREALSHGNTQSDFAQHARGCERSARLAYLCRVRAAPDYYGSEAVYRRAVWRGSERDGLRAGRHDHRSLSLGFSGRRFARRRPP